MFNDHVLLQTLLADIDFWTTSSALIGPFVLQIPRCTEANFGQNCEMVFNGHKCTYAAFKTFCEVPAYDKLCHDMR